MKRSFLSAAFAVALSLGGCAAQSAAQHHAETLGGPASRVVEFPGTLGSHAVEPDTGTDLVLLVHHLGRERETR